MVRLEPTPTRRDTKRCQGITPGRKEELREERDVTSVSLERPRFHLVGDEVYEVTEGTVTVSSVHRVGQVGVEVRRGSEETRIV